MEDIRPNLVNYDPTLTAVPARGIGGQIIEVDWLQALIMRGFGWLTNVGTLITPVIGGGNGTVIVVGRPELMISVPAGYTLIPHRILVQLRAPLLAADNDLVEASIAYDTTQKWDGTGTATAKTPINQRSDLGTACPATVQASFSGSTTQTIVASAEIARMIITGDVQGTAANAMWSRPDLAYEPRNPPLLVGPGMLIVHYGGTVATSGYVQAAFLVVPSTMFTSLN